MFIRIVYISVVIIWSTTPLAVKWSNQGVGFMAAVSMRMLLALLVGLLLLKLFRIRLSLHKAAWLHYGYASIGMFLGMILVYWAADIIPSGLISVLYGLAPFMIGILSIYLLNENTFTIWKIIALLLALTGLILVFQGELTVSMKSLDGVLALLLSVFLFAVSSVLIKKSDCGLHPLEQTVGALIICVPLFLLSWYFTGDVIDGYIPARSMLAIIYTSIIGSIIGFMGYFYLIAKMSTIKVSLIALCTPVIAVLLGNIVDGERIQALTIIGGSVILSALAMYQLDMPLRQLLNRKCE